MFINHVLPEGTLRKAWVASHWERCLKRQDYESADIQGSVAFAREHIASIPLRCLGHLLVGFCRLLLRKTVLFDDRVEEVRQSLQMSRGKPLAAVAVVPEAALTMNRSSREAAWDLVPLADMSADCDLDMVFEPPPLEELLEAGRRHLARGVDYSAPINTLASAQPRLATRGWPG